MAEESTFDRIVKILQEQDGLEDVEITNDTKLSDLGLDSLSVVEAVMACEDEFGIEVDADAAPETVGDFVDMVEALLD
ncbi:acyl carrier protein [Olsenella uli]|uniref:acyl carrier protein n=1 Tax=Olsenella uli TaxID=133926 RepID=UPI0012AB3337|nr:phosphopantetheine-binding protein [Olsenella uli]